MVMIIVNLGVRGLVGSSFGMVMVVFQCCGQLDSGWWQQHHVIVLVADCVAKLQGWLRVWWWLLGGGSLVSPP